jgi:hypothetical protein
LVVVAVLIVLGGTAARMLPGSPKAPKPYLFLAAILNL